MNTLLIYPKFPDTFWSFKHALKFVRKKASLPPLGLLTVAAMLPPEEERRLGITEKGRGYGKPHHMSSLWENNISDNPLVDSAATGEGQSTDFYVCGCFLCYHDDSEEVYQGVGNGDLD